MEKVIVWVSLIFGSWVFFIVVAKYLTLFMIGDL